MQIFVLAEAIILSYAFYHICIPYEEENADNEDNIRMPWKVEQTLNEKLKSTLKSKQFILSYIIMFFGVFYF